MLNTLTGWLKSDKTLPQAPAARHELAATVAELLVEAGLADGDLGTEEEALIAHVIAEQYDLPDAEVAELLHAAIDASDERIELHGLTSKLRAECDYEDRIDVLMMVWMIVLSDAVVDKIESQLMRRLAGLLYVSDVDSGRAQKTARARLGLV